jgi:hypothetical protein
MHAVQGSKGRARILTGVEVKHAEYHPEGTNPWCLEVDACAVETGTGLKTCGPVPPPSVVKARATEHVHADLVLLATGCAVDARDEPLFADLLAACPPPGDTFSGGLPTLDDELRWAPGVHVHLTGAWAAHQIGPDALNLMGGMSAAKRLQPLLRPWLDSLRLVATDNVSSGGEGLTSEPALETGPGVTAMHSSVSRLFGGGGNTFAVLGDADSDEEE